MLAKLIRRAEVVAEALPYLRKFHGAIIVVKYGGGAMTDRELKEKITQDVVLLKYVGMHPVLVHGGGPEINKALKKNNIVSNYVEGLRVTDEKTMVIVDKVLGNVNSRIVTLINKGGGKGRGFSGRKGKLVRAKKLLLTRKKQKIDLGFVGTVKSIDTELLKKTIFNGKIPVISSVGVDKTGQVYNINADYIADEIATAIGARKVIFLSNVAGVLSKQGNLISQLNTTRIRRLIRAGVISGGMIPKVRRSLEAIKQGVETVHIIDGRVPHAVLLEVFTDHGIGTMVVK